MKKINIDGFRLNDNVLITSYNPPLEGRVVDMYEVDSMSVADETLKRKYPNAIPIFEVILKDGKLRPFVKDVVKKA